VRGFESEGGASAEDSRMSYSLLRAQRNDSPAEKRTLRSGCRYII